jgi:hypothetical protein
MSRVLDNTALHMIICSEKLHKPHVPLHKLTRGMCHYYNAYYCITTVYRHGLAQQKRMPIDVILLLMHCSITLTHLLLRTSLAAALKIYHKGSLGTIITTAHTVLRCTTDRTVCYICMHLQCSATCLHHIHTYACRQAERVHTPFSTVFTHVKMYIINTLAYKLMLASIQN